VFTARYGLNVYIKPCTLKLFSCRSLTAEVRVQSKDNLVEISGGQSGPGTGFSLSTLVSPVSNIPTIFHIFLHLNVARNTRKNGGSLVSFQKNNALSKTTENWTRKYFQQVFKA
jgi:hypothetical protein